MFKNRIELRADYSPNYNTEEKSVMDLTQNTITKQGLYLRTDIETLYYQELNGRKEHIRNPLKYTIHKHKNFLNKSKYNYRISIQSGQNDIDIGYTKSDFYCKLNMIDVFCIKWWNNQMWIQKGDNIFKAIGVIVAIIGVIVAILNYKKG